MFIIITLLVNTLTLFLIFHYFKWKLTSYNFLEGFEKKKDEFKNEIDEIIIEINRTTERNLQILEAKIIQLNEITDRSEKVFSALKKQKDTAENTDEIFQKLERKSNSDKIEKLGSPQSVKPIKKNENSAVVREDIRSKVMTMYQNGIDIELISRNLGITSGEAELIISINTIK
ncbi:MAG: hypothetical protein RBT69_02535 [Spirochaetia bacterium]|jgi:hypothetical protein|nr:hypothetical protein [Spirochaetia bacterium]